MIQPAVFRWLKDFYNTSVPHLWFDPAEWFIVTSNDLMFARRTLPTTTKKPPKTCKTLENSLALGEQYTELLYFSTRSWWSSWTAASLQDGCRVGSLCVVAQPLQVWPSHMAWVSLANASSQFLDLFGVNRILWRVWAGSRWAATQLKPWNVINSCIFILLSLALPSELQPAGRDLSPMTAEQPSGWASHRHQYSH